MKDFPNRDLTPGAPKDARLLQRLQSPQTLSDPSRLDSSKEMMCQRVFGLRRRSFLCRHATKGLRGPVSWRNKVFVEQFGLRLNSFRPRHPIPVPSPTATTGEHYAKDGWKSGITDAGSTARGFEVGGVRHTDGVFHDRRRSRHLEETQGDGRGRGERITSG